MTLQRLLRATDPRSSLPARAALLIALAAFAIYLALAWHGARTSARRIAVAQEEEFSRLAEQLAERLDRHVFDVYRELRVLSAAPLPSQPGLVADDTARAVALRGRFENLQNTHGELWWVGLASADGIVEASTEPFKPGQDISAHGWFRAALNAPYFAEVRRADAEADGYAAGPGEGPAGVEIALPVRDVEGQVRGVLAARFGVGWMRDVERAVLGPAASRRGVAAQVIATDGRVLVGSQPERVSTATASATAAAAGPVLGAERAVGEAVSSGFQDFPGFAWRVVVRQSAGAGPPEGLSLAAVGQGAASALLLGALAWALTRRLTRPLLGVAEAAERLRAGETGSLPAVAGGDEVARATTAVAGLIDDLRDAERRQAVLLNRLPGAAYRVRNDASREVAMVSAGIAPLAGYVSEDFTPRGSVAWGELIDPADRDQVAAGIAAAIAEQRSYDLTYRLQPRTGELRWVWDRGRGVAGPQGEAEFLEGFMVDVTERHLAELATREARLRLQHALEASDLALWESDPVSGEIYLSSEWAMLMGDEPRESRTTFQELLKLVHPEDRERATRTVMEVIKGDQAHYHFEHRVRHRSGEWRWILSRGRVIARDGEGKAIRMTGTNIDITDLKRVEARLRDSEAQLRTITDNVPVLIAYIDPGHVCRFANRGYAAIFGLTPEEIVGRSVEDYAGPARYAEVRPYLARVLEGLPVHYERQHVLGESLLRLEVGLYPDLRDGVLAGYYVLANDITDRWQAEERIRRLVHYDELTGLPNRVLLTDRVSQMAASAHRDGRMAAVLMVDLDHFKTINDSLGHQAGDDLLRQTARRLTGVVGEGDTVARLGGDEFVLLVPGLADVAGAARAADRVLAALSRPFNVRNRELHVSASVGVAVYPTDGADAETLLRNADTAMYHAKESGRSLHRFFTADMNTAAQQRLSVEAQLRHALSAGEFQLYYQPRVDLMTDRITGAEALLRWRTPTGMVSPAHFVGVAEQSGLIVQIGEWVVREACRQAAAWRAAGLPPVTLSINVAPRQFARRNIVEVVRSALRETGLDAASLAIEITESTVMQQDEGVLATLEELSLAGVKIAVDDFGVGYSGLAYLKRFRIDELKIDQSFVRGILSDPSDAAIVAAIVAMARALHLRVTAEGVETVEQLAFLRRQGCHEAQGYYFGRAMPAAEFAALITRTRVAA